MNNRTDLKLKLGKTEKALLAVVPVCFLCLFILFVASTKSAQKRQFQLVTDSMREISVNIKQSFDSYIDQQKEKLIALSKYSQVYGMDREEQLEFLRGKGQFFGFSHLFVMNTEGQGFYVDEGGITRNQAKEEFFTNLSAVDEYVTTPFRTRMGLIITICEAMYVDGERVGTLCGAVNLTRVNEQICNYEGVLGSKFYIVDRNGTFIATNDETLEVSTAGSIFSKNEKDEVSLIKQTFEEGIDKQGVITYRGEQYYTYAIYIEACDWVLFQSVKKSVVTDQVKQIHGIEFFMVLSVLILGVLIIRILYLWRKSDARMNRDVLTGLYSRSGCQSMIDQLDQDKKAKVTVVYMDLNRFKYVNDTFGHDQGDILIQTFAKAINEVFYKVGFACRIGGDEFVVFLKDIEESQIDAMLEKLKEILRSEKGVIADENYEISFAYGIAVRQPGDVTAIQRVIEAADEKMYEHKKKY